MLSPRGQSGLEASRPKFWPRLQSKGLASASASKLWPRPQTFGLYLASISLSYYESGIFRAKIV